MEKEAIKRLSYSIALSHTVCITHIDDYSATINARQTVAFKGGK